MKVVCDTDILSSIGKMDRFDILFKVLPNVELLRPEAVDRELMRAKENGSAFPDVIFSNTTLFSTQKEMLIGPELMNSRKELGPGEFECILIALEYDIPMLTNDRSATRHARKVGIITWNLLEVLRASYITGTFSKEGVEQIRRELLQKDGLEVRDSEWFC